MSQIKLIVGLGNPGGEYEHTRHNAGFWLLDELAWRWKAKWAEEKKFLAQVGRATLPSGDVWLLKPQTYMNKSGMAVQALAAFYKIQPNEILVVHDELDIPTGSIRFKQGGGHGGHNGLKDIQARLNSPDFYRLRLGIDHPGDKNLVVHYVLKKPAKEERACIDAAIEKSLTALPQLLADDFAAVQRILHSK